MAAGARDHRAEPAPTCPSCGAQAISADDHHGLIEPWLKGAEPEIRCVACGRPAPAGDLEGLWSFHIGELAVVFNNWPPLTEAFIAELGALMGPRPRLVLERI